MFISQLCVALLGILLIGLGFTVSMTRRRLSVSVGHSSDLDDPLFKVVRAHGNATEYVPILALVIFALGTMSPAAWMVWCMVLVTVCRYVHALGLTLPKSMAKTNPMRFIGATGTYFFGMALCVALLIKAIQGTV